MVHSLKKLLFVCCFFAPWAHSQVYNQFQCGGDLNGAGCTWNNQVITPSAVTLAKQAALAADSFIANATNASATPQAVNPLAAANLLSAVLNVTAVSTVNVTTSGVQTVDGVALANGQSVLLTGQTSSVNDGIWIVNSAGAWTRPINFPAGYIIAQNCDVFVIARQGTVRVGQGFRLATGSGAITIGTTGQAWGIAAQVVPTATNSVLGIVKVTDSSTELVPSMDGAPIDTGGNVIDCVGFEDTAGSVGDTGNPAGTLGPCVVSDANGHPTLNGNGTAPVITGTGCTVTSVVANDNSGAVAAAGIDTCTITFGSAFTKTPFCAVSGYSATALPFISTAPTTTAFIVKTAAAGTFSYVCL
jgi:hypothetical protein